MAATEFRPVWSCALAAAIACLVGCVSEADLGGGEIPKNLPDTHLNCDHPSTLEAGFIICAFWEGKDADGAIRGYQLKLSTNSDDGISVHDTLTIDPATGDTLNPWTFTTATDSVIIVSADLPGFSEDSHLDPVNQRSYQAHTLFVRAVDQDGGIDPTPAQVSFTATTLLPRIYIDQPIYLSDYQDAQSVPPTITFGYTGRDKDTETKVPTHIRYLLKTTWLDGHYVRTEYEFNQVMDDLVSFEDSAWSDWQAYPAQVENRKVVFSQLPISDTDQELIIYMFAIQARDTADAVSIERNYSRNVHNFYISNMMRPVIEIQELHLGRQSSSGVNGNCSHEIAPSQELFFNWLATAEHYANDIAAYRYGWDVQDPDDPDDPNWAMEPGVTSQHLRTGVMSFASDTHTLTIQAWDGSGQLSRYVWHLSVVPVPDFAARRQLLLVDDVQDKDSHGWPGVGGAALDKDPLRDFFWNTTLGGTGGVQGWAQEADIIDTEEQDFTFRDLSKYRMVLWSSRYAQQNFIWDNFRPFSNTRPYNWLYCYQQLVGDVFMVGERVMSEFINASINWILPWVFNSDESTINLLDMPYVQYYLGFGSYTQLDGSVINKGRECFAYKAMGLSVLDHTTPKYRPYFPDGPTGIGNAGRSANCVGVKAAVIDPDFRANHLPDNYLIPDTMYVDSAIDWMDEDPDYRNQLRPWYLGGSDEMYDINITERPTHWQPQTCAGEPCVEPMIRMYSRYDWVDDLNAAIGNEEWPLPYMSGGMISSACGRYAIDASTRRSLTSGAVMGFLSHKMQDTKPSRIADVVWGFDPYRFENEQMQLLLQWILKDNFGLIMNP